jgi:hypothetical protein
MPGAPREVISPDCSLAFALFGSSIAAKYNVDVIAKVHPEPVWLVGLTGVSVDVILRVFRTTLKG